jgi:hypothetical protein
VLIVVGFALFFLIGISAMLARALAATATFVQPLKRAGEVQILQYTPSVQLPLTRETGTGRVAWRAGSGRPVVQCVRVRRDGPMSGAKVELLSISAPIGNDDACP